MVESVTRATGPDRARSSRGKSVAELGIDRDRGVFMITVGVTDWSVQPCFRCGTVLATLIGHTLARLEEQRV